MIKLIDNKVISINGREFIPLTEENKKFLDEKFGPSTNYEELYKGTIAYQILENHNYSKDDKNLKIKFDSITSHDITYVGIIQTAIASGMTEFPIPYALTNCHNSLCAVGGTINEDDHMFALSAAKKYGGIYVPTNLAVIHSYNREMMAKSGAMILGSDSHTRYGALGTMAVGEGGGELAKQLLKQTYDIKYPEVIAINLIGKPDPSVGPQDVALQIIKAVFDCGFVQNKVMEFVGEGIENLSIDFRNGIDVMTTETTCWSSIWETDEKTKEHYVIHKRPQDYKKLSPKHFAQYDGLVEVDLSKIKPSIALPFHPSNVYTIEELKKNPYDIFSEVEKNSKKLFESSNVVVDLKSKIKNGEIHVDQGIIVGCSGGNFESIVAASDILRGQSIGSGQFTMSVYPGSQPINIELVKNGTMTDLLESGVITRSAFCGPCFGAGDTPANNELSIRHATRNFPNRDGSKPGEGQISIVALMDAKSIAATARNHGKLTGADEIEVDYKKKGYNFDEGIYEKRVYNGWGNPQANEKLIMGPNIKPWPKMPELTDHMILKVVSYITDPVTTTDELIPSGETSSYRSNPLRLAEFTLSRKDPNYVSEAKAVFQYEISRQNEENVEDIPEIKKVYEIIRKIEGFENVNSKEIGIGSTIYAHNPGDGSAREQAASSQRVLGAWANITKRYATKRYRSNLINWGILPFLIEDESFLSKGKFIFIPNIREKLINGEDNFEVYVLNENIEKVKLTLGFLTSEEREILANGCLINYNKKNN